MHALLDLALYRGAQGAMLASVHPETLSFWNRWLNSDFWRRKARRFRISCGCTALQSEATRTVGADNAPGTHHPAHYIRSVCSARDRLRTKGDVAMAGRPAPAGQPGCGWPAAAGSA